MIKKLVVLSCLVASTMFVSGCDLSEGQIKLVARNAGLGASIAWIAYESPDSTTKSLVVQALEVTSEAIKGVVSGESYMEKAFPYVEDFVRSDKVPDNYEPLVLGGALASLNALDLLFITNPQWKEKQDLALGVATEFISGATVGLGLDDNDPLIIEAGQLRSKMSSFEAKSQPACDQTSLKCTTKVGANSCPSKK